MMKMCEKVLIFNLKKLLAQASSAGYSVTSSNSKNGIGITFQGYNDKMSLLIDTTTKFIPKAISETEVSTFEVLKEDLKETFYESLMAARELNGELFGKVLLDGQLPKFELYQEIDKITHEKLKNFSTQFIANLKVQVLAQGNLRRSEALSITNLILTNLNCGKLNKELQVKSRCFEMPQGETVLRARSLLLNDDNSYIRDFYQIGRDTLRCRCLARLIVAILNPKAYDYLRSREQLGYGVGVTFEEMGRVIGISIIVLSQESKHNYEEVGRKMKVFMDEIATKTIQDLTDDEFESFKDARIKLLSAEDLDLEVDFKRNGYEITDQEYIFDRNELAVKLTRNFTKSELQDFFKNFTAPEKIHKLSLQVIGNPKTAENLVKDNSREINLTLITEKLTEDEKVVTDIEAFQKGLNLYAVGHFVLDM